MRWKKPKAGDHRSIKSFPWIPVKDWETGWTYWLEHIWRDQRYNGNEWLDQAIRPVEGETGYG